MTEKIPYPTLENFFDSSTTICHDCGKTYKFPEGYDGLPGSQSEGHYWFYEEDQGVFACCMVIREEFPKRRATLFHHCQYSK